MGIIENLAPCFPLHQSVFFHPEYLTKHRIPFNVAHQKPGELVIVDECASHEGWNAGNSLATATKFLDVKSARWIQHLMPNESNQIRWPCVCGSIPTPMDPKPSLPRHFQSRKGRLSSKTSPADLPYSLHSWINGLMPYIDKKEKELMQGNDKFSAMWRHVHRRELAILQTQMHTTLSMFKRHFYA